MRLFFRYLKSKRTTLFAILFFVFFFGLYFKLYGLPMRAILYPTIVCGVVGTAILLVDFLNERKKHIELMKATKFKAELLESLPNPRRIENEDYQQIIRLLQDELISENTKALNKYTDMLNYFSMWVHQIKTPIASMKLYLEGVDSEVGRQLSMDLSRIEQYVEMVMTFVRLDSESTDYVFRECRIDNLVRSVVKKFSLDFIMKKLKFNMNIGEVTVVTDEKWLAFALEQLIGNAIKYTNKGEISVYMVDDSTLCIEDTGIGIKEEDLPRIFEKGYTGFNGRENKKASGIGLFLTKSILDKLGLTIRAESKVGVGTKMYIKMA